MKFIKKICAASCIAFAVGANAQEVDFQIHSNGTLPMKEVLRTVVSKDFAKRYPSKEWSIFVYTHVFAHDQFTTYCASTAGLVPRDSGRFPEKVVTYETTTPLPIALSGNSVQGPCAADAVKLLMRSDLASMYPSNPARK